MHAATLARELPADLRKLSSEQHAAAIERSRRLELHFLPRINAVEPAELLDAQARGREDAVTFRKLSDACNNKCSATSGAAAASTCIQQCTAGSETAQRTRDCDDISWLPLQEGQKP